MADSGAHHVTRATFFRNGDPNFKGKMMVVNPRYYRNFESFLDTVTWSTRSTNAVTRICTPHGRNFVHSVDSFQNGGNYVVLGRERFKKLNYGEAKNKTTATRFPSILRNQMPSSGRYRKVYEGEKQALKRIYVYRNGDNKTPARMILLKRRNLADMEFVLQTLQESRINCDFAISKLFTLQGKQILSCDEIMHDGRYVAMERGSRFKPINYEAISNFSPRSAVNATRFTKLPPIATRVNPEKLHHSPRKSVPPVTDKVGVSIDTNNKRTEKKRTEKREPKRIANPPMPAQDSIVSPFEDQDLTRESFSHVSLSVTPPPLDESPDFTLSEKIGKQNAPSTENIKKTSTMGLAAITHLGNLPDKQQDLGLQLYNASGMQREWGEMVVDSKNAVTDKPIDHVTAEEIDDEEITENDDNSREKSNSDWKINSEELNASRQQSVEEVINAEQEQNEDETEKEYEIKATANRLVEKILQEEEDSEPNFDNDQRLNAPSVAEKDRQETNDVTEKKEDDASCSQEDINSEDEVQSCENDSNREDEKEKVDKSMSDNDTVTENEEPQSNERKPQSEGEEIEEDEDEEEQAAKENRTNKKAEKERQDPVEAKKNQLKERHDKRRQRGKVGRKDAQVKSENGE